MHNTAGEAVELVRSLVSSRSTKKDVDVVVCPPFTALRDVGEELKSYHIRLGAQNVHWEDTGAFTGEISPVMLKELGVRYVIVGHSERRKILGETDEMIRKKVRKVLEKDMIPILCVGETLEERKAGRTEEIIRRQIEEDLRGLRAEEVKQAVIAYEPIWAIGTGQSATAEDANRIIGFIRGLVGDLAGQETAAAIRILYGGSVKPENVRKLLGQPHIDGALVGGASLKAGEFLYIIDEASGKEKI